MMAISAFVAWAVASCGVGDVDLSGKTCPCADGFVCDVARNVCVLPAELDARDGSSVVDGATLTDAAADASCGEAGCPCSSDAQCTDPTSPICDTSVSLCVACTVADDRCPAGRYCTVMDTCTVGCKTNAECMQLSPSAPYCDQTRRQCVQCKSTTDCTGAQICSPSGTCVDACAGEGGTCTGGKSCCTALCVDTKSDVDNCNGCGLACTGGNTLCCSSSCTNPATSAMNCGSCGYACSTTNATPSCSGGTCEWACQSGYAHCASGNTGCETNTTNTTAHCGSCGRDCGARVVGATGISCASSQCTYATCQAGHYDCDGIKSNGCETTTQPCPTCGLQGQPCCTTGASCVSGMNLECHGGTCSQGD